MHPCNHTVFGNLEQTLAKLTHADPNFVMGKVMSLSLQLLGENARQKPKLLYDVNNFEDKAQRSNISSWYEYVIIFSCFLFSEFRFFFLWEFGENA